MTTILFQSHAFVVYDYDIMVHVNETSYPYRDRWIEGDQACAKLRANIVHLLKSSGQDVEKFLSAKLSQEIK